MCPTWVNDSDTESESDSEDSKSIEDHDRKCTGHLLFEIDIHQQPLIRSVIIYYAF